MKYLILDVLNTFQCVGKKCPYTCCRGWKINIDSYTANFYRSVEGKFGEKLKNSIIDNDGVSAFKMNNGSCPFLNKESLCDVYINLGENHLCTTCKVYPRRNWNYGDITFVGKGISCPEVARILFEASSPIQFGFTEDTSIPNECVDWSAFNVYIRGMTASIEILQNQKLDFPVRMRAILLLNYCLEKKLNSNSDCTVLFDMFSSVDTILSLTEKISHLNTDYGTRITLFQLIAQNIAQITANDPIFEYISLGIKFLQNQNMEDVKQFWKCGYYLEDGMDSSHIHEQYSVYYISAHYMDFYKRQQPYKFMVQFFTLFYLQNCFEAFAYMKHMKHLSFSNIIEIYTKTARTYEHSYENKNLETTYSILEKNEMISLPFLSSLI